MQISDLSFSSMQRMNWVFLQSLGQAGEFDRHLSFYNITLDLLNTTAR